MQKKENLTKEKETSKKQSKKLFEPATEKTPIPLVLNKFNLRDFKNPNKPHYDFKTNSTITVYGKRGTGKSFFVRWWLYNYQDIYPWGWVFTKTKNNRFYESFIPESRIFEGYSPVVLSKIVDRQKITQSMMLRGDDVNPLAFVIWDDAMDNNIKYDDFLASYYFTSRHYHTMNIMTAQYVKSTPPAIRQNTDHAVLFANSNLESIEVLSEDFAVNKDKHQFKRLMDETTQDRSFLLVNNDPNVPFEERYFTGKAEETPIWTAGSQEYWNRNMDQFFKIKTGKFEEETEKIKKWSEAKYVVKTWDEDSQMAAPPNNI